MSIERRSENREPRCIPTNIGGQGDGIERVALVHDASAHGVTLFTREPHAVGEHLQLELHTDLTGTVLPATGRVIHFERRDLDQADIWTWQLGLELDTSLAAYQAEIESLTAKQRANGILPS